MAEVLHSPSCFGVPGGSWKVSIIYEIEQLKREKNRLDKSTTSGKSAKKQPQCAKPKLPPPSTAWRRNVLRRCLSCPSQAIFKEWCQNECLTKNGGTTNDERRLASCNSETGKRMLKTRNLPGFYLAMFNLKPLQLEEYIIYNPSHFSPMAMANPQSEESRC